MLSLEAESGRELNEVVEGEGEAGLEGMFCGEGELEGMFCGEDGLEGMFCGEGLREGRRREGSLCEREVEVWELERRFWGRVGSFSESEAEKSM